MSLTLTVTGTRELERELLRRGGMVTHESAGALFQEGESIMGDSQEHYVPVDLAILKNSGHVQLPTLSSDGIEVRMGYGGPAKDYAVVQHERMDFHHSVGGPKYLERPLLAAARGLCSRLAGRIKAAFT